MNRFRIFKDFDLSEPVATITPKQLQPPIVDVSRLQWVSGKEIEKDGETITKVFGGYDLSGITVENDVLQSTEGNTIPLERFTKYEVSAPNDLYNDQYRQTIYTEGKTRFYLYFGEDSTNVYLWISNADMFTNGDNADENGFEGVPIRYATSYSGFVCGGYGIPTFITLDKTLYSSERQNINIRFVSCAVKFPNETESTQCYFAVVTAKPINTTPGEERNFDIVGVINLYSANVFDGIENYENAYAPTTGNVTRGGTGTGYYPHDIPEGANFERMITERNNALSATMGSGKGLSWYTMTATGFANSLAFAYGHDTFMGEISADKRLAAYVGAYMLPVAVSGTAAPFWLADDVRNFNDGATNCSVISDRLVYGDCGTIDLSSYGWDDFNDFENTRATLFLPFVGTVNIDINAIARGAINVKYVVDVCNGNISFWVYTSSMQGMGELLYAVYTGNCSVQIPTSGVYKGNVLDKILNAGTAIASGDAVGIAKVAVDSVVDVRVNKAGGIDTSSAAISRYQPRLDIEKKEILRVDQYKEITGIPAFVTKNLATLSGFVQISECNLTGLTGEEQEKAELMALLKEGIYL